MYAHLGQDCAGVKGALKGSLNGFACTCQLGQSTSLTMAELPNPTDVANLVSLLAPGLIISMIRTRAITGSAPDIKDRLISYAIISTVYFAVTTPLFNVVGGVSISAWLSSLLQNFALPVIAGIALAYVYQWQWSYKLAERFKLIFRLRGITSLKG
jgi:hypothetical protein